MILTGTQIEIARNAGTIIIEPFVPEFVNPNSYNFRLGKTLRTYDEAVLDPRHENRFTEIEIPDDGYVLEPSRLYLAHTVEKLGGTHYAPTFAARSSVARLGLFINLSAPLGDIGFIGQWTLQLFAAAPVRVYAGMQIGQMMWWQPTGTVQLYDGKYQAAAGVRSSDIYKDFLKPQARAALPRLGSDITPDVAGSKFCNLSRLTSVWEVPDAFSIPATVLVPCVSDELLERMRLLMEDIRATVGAFTADAAAELASIAREIELSTDIRALLETRLEEFRALYPGSSWAVRSSAPDEDSLDASNAGIYTTCLQLRTTADVIAAVRDCLASWFEWPAVASRVRNGNFDHVPRMALLVQRMIEPDFGGVAFSYIDAVGSTSTTVEWVAGLGENLVSGVAAPHVLEATDDIPLDQPWLGDVRTMAARVCHHLSFDADVEWVVSEGRVYLLQARPITAAATSPLTALESGNLYGPQMTGVADLGEVAAIYASYVTKRGPVHRAARAAGFRTGEGLVLRFDATLLDEDLAKGSQGSTVRSWLDATQAGEYVLDFNEHMRQIIVTADDVVPQLRTYAAACRPGVASNAIVREFVRGDVGAITELSGGDLILEVSAEGLLALNRGTAGASQIRITGHEHEPQVTGGAVADDLLEHVRRNAPALHRFAVEMADTHSAQTLEWIIDNGSFMLIDYSAGEQEENCYGGRVIFNGSASGPVFDLRGYSDLLERMSIGPAISITEFTTMPENEKFIELCGQISQVSEELAPPILIASRPYAALSVILRDVAGFVFEQGSALCHLSILLREARIPAVISEVRKCSHCVIASEKVIFS